MEAQIASIATALKHYEAVKRASNAYYERKRQAKKDAGTYRGRGRPKKDVSPEPDCCGRVKGEVVENSV
jgi:hypothetical protein